jgi:hypothetical protein
VEKLDGLLLLLNNFVGQMKENSIDVMELLFGEIF